MSDEKRRDGSEDLIDFWEDVLGPRPESVRDRLVRELGVPHPGRLTLATNTGRVIVEIEPDGTIRLGEGITPNDAAEEFLTALALKRPGMEERLMHLGVMESLMTRLGRADHAYEQAQLRARSPEGTEEDKYREELQRRNLEALVHQVIEFSRGLVTRGN